MSDEDNGHLITARLYCSEIPRSGIMLVKRDVGAGISYQKKLSLAEVATNNPLLTGMSSDNFEYVPTQIWGEIILGKLFRVKVAYIEDTNTLYWHPLE